MAEVNYVISLCGITEAVAGGCTRARAMAPGRSRPLITELDSLTCHCVDLIVGNEGEFPVENYSQKLGFNINRYRSTIKFKISSA
jgi:hypothetical protein